MESVELECSRPLFSNHLFQGSLNADLYRKPKLCSIKANYVVAFIPQNVMHRSKAVRFYNGFTQWLWMRLFSRYDNPELFAFIWGIVSESLFVCLVWKAKEPTHTYICHLRFWNLRSRDTTDGKVFRKVTNISWSHQYFGLTLAP